VYKRQVWNIGEAPVDGATDFLFMVIVAFFHKIGFNIELATRIPPILSHLAVIYLIYHTLTKRQQAPIWIGLLFSLYVGIGPGLAYIESYFGTPVFACAGLASWLLCLHMTFKKDAGRKEHLAFSLTALTMGLIRPEGVLLAGLMLLSSIFYRGWAKSKASIITFISVFGTLGTAYFAWRWWYFSYPLPNPFYVKGGGSLHVMGLVFSILFVIRMAWPFLLIWLGSVVEILLQPAQQSQSFLQKFHQHPLFKKLVFYLIPVSGFTLIWILLSDEMNYFMRFQYVLLPIIAVSVYPLLPQKLPFVKAALIIIAIFMLGWQHLSYGSKNRFFSDGRQILAKALSTYADEGYTLLTSEAGLLPFYSNWHAIDSWGLNDQFIAHEGLITEAYMEQADPELIMIHESMPQQGARPIESLSKWTQMSQRVKAYAEHHSYELVATYGVKPNNVHHYYLKKDFEEREKIAQIIKEVDYPWFINGKKCQNFAASTPAE